MSINQSAASTHISPEEEEILRRERQIHAAMEEVAGNILRQAEEHWLDVKKHSMIFAWFNGKFRTLSGDIVEHRVVRLASNVEERRVILQEIVFLNPYAVFIVDSKDDGLFAFLQTVGGTSAWECLRMRKGDSWALQKAKAAEAPTKEPLRRSLL